MRDRLQEKAEALLILVVFAGKSNNERIMSKVLLFSALFSITLTCRIACWLLSATDTPLILDFKELYTCANYVCAGQNA